MMTCRIDRIFAVGISAPNAIGKKLNLTVQRPGTETAAMLDVLIAHFLQKNNIGLQLAD